MLDIDASDTLLKDRFGLKSFYIDLSAILLF